MTIGAAASPLCYTTWLFAAYMSSAVAGFADDASVSSGPSGSPSGRRLRKRNASSKRLAGASWSVKTDSVQSRSFANVCMGAPCASGIAGLGSYLVSESCPEDDSIKNETGPAGDVSFFGAGLPGLKTRPVKSVRRPLRATTGKASAVATPPVQPIKASVESKKTSTKPRRVVVTGMGVVSSLGHDADTFYANLLEGKSGVSEIENFDCKEFPTRIAGEIKSFSPDGFVAGKFARRMDKFMLYLLTAGKKAVVNAGLLEEELDKSRCGVLIGSAMGGMQIFNDAIEALRVSYRKMNPFCVPFATTNMGSAMLAMDLGWMGPNYSISTACATSNFCILNAANHIIRGEARTTAHHPICMLVINYEYCPLKDIMLSGGSDAAIIPIGLGGFVACRALSQRNNDPSRASRPWDKDRDGFVMGEGAGVLLLEELEHAKARGAEIYAEFLGGSFSCDAYHTTEPHPEGAGVLLCIDKALAQAGVNRHDVNYVNAHATSTKAGDLQEYKALMRSFGENPELRINSTKSMIGHLLGASGAVEAIATVQAIRSGWVHPTINLINPENDVDMKVMVGGEKEKLDIKVALSNSFGFGGQNSSILFAPYIEANET